jgi:ABC-type nitrate/sulfonate/bicarbonate transport system, permease component
MNKDKQNLEDQLQLWRQNKKKENLKYVLLSAAGILSVLVIWQLAVVLGLVNERLLPAPTRILNTLIFKINNKAPDGNMLGVNIMASLQVALSGFLAAIVIGVPLGLLMGWWTYADRFIRPIFELIRPVPPIAWIPLVVVWMGVGLKAKALIIFLQHLFPALLILIQASSLQAKL